MKNKNMNKVVLISKGLIVLAAIVALIILIVMARETVFSDYYEVYTSTHDQESMVYWNVIIMICSLPCFAALVVGWKIMNQVRDDEVFTLSCVNNMKQLLYLALFDVIFLFVCTTIMFIQNRVYPGLFITCVVVTGLGMFFTVIFYIIYTFLNEAVLIKEESELTI